MVEADDDAAAMTKTTVFPVALFDGEREMDVGNIKIHPDLLFKEFQMMLSQMIGISYNNLTTYLVDSTKSKFSPDRRRILITGKVNFAVIVLERNCYFLVVLKRSRRDRRKKPNKQIPFVPPGYSLHLHRTHLDLIHEQLSSGYSSYGYDDRFQDFEMMKQNYINSVLNWNQVLYPQLNASSPTVEEAYESGRSRALCEDCTRAENQGSKAAFHFCVYDDVVAGFRSPVGPISRPS